MDNELNLSSDAKALFESFGKPAKIEDVQQKDPVSELLAGFDKELNSWDLRIKSMSSQMKDIGRCIDVQSELYDSRHELAEAKHKLLRTISKFNLKHKEKYAERLRHYSVNSDRKYTVSERDKLIESDLGNIKYKIELIENHLNHIDQIFKLVDHMLYGIKNRVLLEEYLRKI
jgi:chromosome segregation ATPase